MHNKPLEKRRLADIEAAIGRAKDYAAAQEVPLTVERLAAEMDMDLSLFHRILQGQITPTGRSLAAKIAAIQRAGGEATASVMEHALRRGTSPNMHIMYLKNNAGYDGEKTVRSAKEDPDAYPAPVIFLGEEDIPD